MSKCGKKWGPLAALLLAFIVLPVIFSSCKNVLGFGDSIDWEPPVLTLDPGPNPRYVNNDDNSSLSGTVTDNVVVEKVICRDALTGRQIGTARLLSGDRWSMKFNFTEADNGERISAEIVAYDKAGNSGEESIKTVTLIVDLHPPIFETPRIYRSNSRTAELERYNILKALETSDPYSANYQNVERYQNGTFWIKTKVSEEETTIDAAELYLRIFDVNHDNENDFVYEKLLDSGSGVYAPQWTVKESELVSAGNSKGWGYDTILNRPNTASPANNRLYFRVRLVAKDLRGNKAEWVEDFGYFCVSRAADKPKAILTGGILSGDIISGGTLIPVDVFDDDSVEIAWVDLLTYTQFQSYSGVNDAEKLLTIQETLENGGTNDGLVYNWMNANRTGAEATGDEAKVINRVLDKSGLMPAMLPEMTPVSVNTGTTGSDYGDYRLIAIVKDKKQEPHIDGDDSTGWQPTWERYIYYITISDNDVPLIVIDTVNTNLPEGTGMDEYDKNNHLGVDIITGASTGNSPEENTFPKLDNGKFVLNGYTLRGMTKDVNLVDIGEVVDFKMAWIPAGMPGGADSYVDAVKTALGDLNAADSNWPSALSDVQRWVLSNYPYVSPASTSYWMRGTNQDIPKGGTKFYAKQVFMKTFDVLGGPDDLKPGYNNFYYNGVRENDAKLFVLYAKDNYGKEFTRTIRLLGNRTPPALKIYDYTANVWFDSPNVNEINLDNGFYAPAASTPYYPSTNPNTSSWANAKETYDSTNAVFHQQIYQEQFYNRIKTLAPSPLLESVAFQPYPRGKTHKMYAVAENQGDIEIDSIKMYNITNGSPDFSNPSDPLLTTLARGYYNSANRDLSYVAGLPDLLQRIFLFVATDKLGNEARIQRTVAVTATSVMEEVITPLPDNDVRGVGETIRLQAHFSSAVQVKAGPGGQVPTLNVRYQNGSGAGDWVYVAVPFSGFAGVPAPNETSAPTMYLDFNFTVPEGANAGGLNPGELQTIDISLRNDDAGKGVICDKPIDLPAGVQILDAERQIDAFLPAGTTPDTDKGFILSWTDGRHCLQGNAAYPGKTIYLDGTRPVVTSFDVGGKAPYEKIAGIDYYYFKAKETINFTLRATKTIRTGDGTTSGSGNPRIEFRIKQTNGVYYPNNTSPASYFANYQRPQGQDGMLFSIDTDTIATPTQGEIEIVGLNTAFGTVKDNVGNNINQLNALSQNILIQEYEAKALVVLDKVPPPALTPLLGGTEPVYKYTTTNAGNLVNKYNINPVLTLDGIATSSQEYWGSFAEYSLNDGVSWVKFDDATNALATAPGTSYPRPEWAVYDGGLKIKSSSPAIWQLKVRQKDKAGNITPDETRGDLSYTYDLDINSTFPKLVSVSVRQPNGTYTEGPIIIDLDFADPVYTVNQSWTTTANRAYIIVTGRDELPSNSSYTNLALEDERHWAKVYITPKANNNTSTLSFVWGTEDYASAAFQNEYPEFTGKITSNLNKIIGNQMPGGITITEICLSDDVVDTYGNPAVNSLSATPYNQVTEPGGKITMDETPAYDLKNIDGKGILIFTIPPKLIDTWPKSAGSVAPGSEADSVMGKTPVYSPDNKTITLKFDVAVLKEVGTISIKPHGDFPIPPVFPSTGYTNGDGEYVPGFYEVYNSSFIDEYAASHNNNPSAAALRNYLRATTWTNASGGILAVPANPLNPGAAYVTDGNGKSLTSGLDFGPYKLTTQGLKQGAGYAADPVVTGYLPLDNSKKKPDENFTTVAAGLETGWNPVETDSSGHHFMVPDTDSKFVLDYLYPNTSTVTAVTNIRTALNAAHYRWRDIDVISSQVKISGDTVTIELDTPLPAGFTWDLVYPEGTFVDGAGNKAPAMGNNQFWFWTDGVQKPVIRVDRKSVDYRNGLDRRALSDLKPIGYSATTTGASPAVVVGDFNYINFRIESETPGAVLKYQTIRGGGVSAGSGEYANASIAITTWTGNDTNTPIANSNPLTSWNTSTPNSSYSIKNNTAGQIYGNTNGTWILPNLLRRAISGISLGNNGITYNVVENGAVVTRTGIWSYGGVRSFNRDITIDELEALESTLVDVPSTQTANIDVRGTVLAEYKASKNYVVAKAYMTHGAYTAESGLGYEGIFKTVVALNQPIGNQSQSYFNNANGSTPQMIVGSNNLNPTPSIEGFPMMLQNQDCRYMKYPYRPGATQLMWISTEIISTANFQFGCMPNNSSIYARPLPRSGDIGIYQSGGYGELTYSYNLDTY